MYDYVACPHATTLAHEWCVWLLGAVLKKGSQSTVERNSNTISRKKSSALSHKIGLKMAVNDIIINRYISSIELSFEQQLGSKIETIYMFNFS